MNARIGIDGFGRMGRLGLRAAWGCDEIEFAHVNEIAGDAACSAHLLKFDSVHGTWGPDCGADEAGLLIEGRHVGYSSNHAIGETDWSGCDLVVEASGKFRTPELEGKLNGLAVRVPLLNASLTDFVFEAARPVTVEEVNDYFREAAQGELDGILGYEERPLVSIDFKDDPRSSIVDAPSTMVIDGTQVKVLAWYDNEWGYANRMMGLARKVAHLL